MQYNQAHVFSCSLCLLALNADGHGLLLFLLANHLHQQCSHNLGDERNGSRTDIVPHMDADGSQRGARE